MECIADKLLLRILSYGLPDTVSCSELVIQPAHDISASSSQCRGNNVHGSSWSRFCAVPASKNAQWIIQQTLCTGCWSYCCCTLFSGSPLNSIIVILQHFCIAVSSSGSSLMSAAAVFIYAAHCHRWLLLLIYCVSHFFVYPLLSSFCVFLIKSQKSSANNDVSVFADLVEKSVLSPIMDSESACATTKCCKVNYWNLFLIVAVGYFLFLPTHVYLS